MKVTEKKLQYILKYQKEKYSLLTVKLRKDSDQDILNFLESVPNRSEYIKKLIRDSMDATK